MPARVKITNSKEKTIVTWTYSGKAKVKPKVFFASPGFSSLHEAQSFALSAILPVLALHNEKVIFEKPVPQNVIDFWYTKMRSLSHFYKSPMRCAIAPVGEAIEEKGGDEVALLMGCGADSLATLGKLLGKGVKPHLVLIQERQHKECFVGGLRTKSVEDLASDFNLNLLVVESNLWFFGFSELFKFLKKDVAKQILKREYISIANSNVVRGFKMFFSSLAVLPPQVGKLIVGSSMEDRSEWFGMGFNYANNLSYLGVSVEPFRWPRKVDQYKYLYNERPEFIKYQKTCTDPNTRWCGKCWNCNMVRCMQLALGVENPLEASMVKCFDPASTDMLRSALEQYAGKDSKIINELNNRFHYTGK